MYFTWVMICMKSFYGYQSDSLPSFIYTFHGHQFKLLNLGGSEQVHSRVLSSYLERVGENWTSANVFWPTCKLCLPGQCTSTSLPQWQYRRALQARAGPHPQGVSADGRHPRGGCNTGVRCCSAADLETYTQRVALTCTSPVEHCNPPPQKRLKR